MSLSTKTLQLLAKTLAPTIAEKIMQSEEFVELLHSTIPALIEDELGEIDDDVLFDLSMITMEKMSLSVYD
jgi:hypothetical protein